MSATKDTWFIAARSEALTGFLLTARTDVRIRDKRAREDGVDFFAEINTGEALSTRIFVVQVQGTMTSNPAEWLPSVAQFFHGKEGAVFLPVCIVVVDVRENNAFFAWLAEPVVEPNGAVLRVHPEGDFHPLDAAAVDHIVESVKDWYDRRPCPTRPAAPLVQQAG